MFVAACTEWSHNVGMRNTPDVMTASMASDGHRLRHIRERVGAFRFARAAHIALTSSKTFDEALAEESLEAWPQQRHASAPQAR